MYALPGDELGLRVEYDTDVFDAAGIEALVERLRRVLAAMVADPDRRLSSVDVLDEAEYAQLDGWGNRAVLTEPVTAAVSIPEMFAAQVARAPGSGGVERAGTARGRTANWMRHANRLAHLLSSRARARVSVWRCCSPGLPRRSWRSWRC